MKTRVPELGIDCEIFHHERFWVRETPLDTAVAFDRADPEATGPTFESCGLIRVFWPTS